jgi:Cu/Ag efflux pump CusA
VTGALEGVPGSTAVRGSSMADMAYVDVVFRSEAALPRARRDRPPHRRAAAAAAGRRSRPGRPEASATGWVLQYALRPPEGSSRCRWARPSIAGRARQIRRCASSRTGAAPALIGIPGVAEVATLGGEREEVVVQTTDAELRAAAPRSRTSRSRCGRGSAARPADRGARSRARPVLGK